MLWMWGRCCISIGRDHGRFVVGTSGLELGPSGRGKLWSGKDFLRCFLRVLVLLAMQGGQRRRYGCLRVVGSRKEVFQVETSSSNLASWSSLHRSRGLLIVARAIGWILPVGVSLWLRVCPLSLEVRQDWRDGLERLDLDLLYFFFKSCKHRDVMKFIVSILLDVIK